MPRKAFALRGGRRGSGSDCEVGTEGDLTPLSELAGHEGVLRLDRRDRVAAIGRAKGRIGRSGERHAAIKTIPGAPHWGLAPISMAWQGRTLRQICELIKDPGRNGGRSLAQIRSHLAEDHLVGWAWHPGDGREPAPGTQAQFGKLIDAWIATGASCPSG